MLCGPSYAKHLHTSKLIPKSVICMWAVCISKSLQKVSKIWQFVDHLLDIYFPPNSWTKCSIWNFKTFVSFFLIKWILENYLFTIDWRKENGLKTGKKDDLCTKKCLISNSGIVNFRNSVKMQNNPLIHQLFITWEVKDKFPLDILDCDSS